MPAKLFFELNPDKRNKIMEAGIEEFSNYGYEGASTNRIVHKCEISKGSLFKYFANKEDLYFYILDSVSAEFIGDLEKKTCALPPDLFQRVMEYAALEFQWYMENPLKAKLIVRAFAESCTEIYQKTIKRYGTKELTIYNTLTQSADSLHFRWDKEKTISVLKWFLKGFNTDFIENISDKNRSFAQLHDEYMRSLTLYMEMLKKGLTE